MLLHEAAAVSRPGCMRFDCRFALRMSFQALQSDGLILTMLSSETDADEYFIVYLRGGRLVASMASSSDSAATRSLTSRYRYDDANWWQVRRY